MQIRRPRVRAGGEELSLPTFQAFADTDPLNRRALEQMLVGVARRQYARSLEPIGAEPIGLTVRSATETRGSQAAEFVLRRFAQQTGGRAFFPTEATQLAHIYAEIKAELSSQYSLAYESTNARRDGQFRRIAVRLDRTGVVARTRPGYYAPAK